MAINEVLQQMRILAAKARNVSDSEMTTQAPGADFGRYLKQAVDEVNDVQQTSKQLGDAYTLGDPTVSLVDVTLASQKAGLAFHAAVHVRNKIVSAYQEVMSMQV